MNTFEAGPYTASTNEEDQLHYWDERNHFFGLEQHTVVYSVCKYRQTCKTTSIFPMVHLTHYD